VILPILEEPPDGIHSGRHTCRTFLSSTFVHKELQLLTGLRTVQGMHFEVPFGRLVRVIALGMMTTLPRYALLVDIEALRTDVMLIEVLQKRASQ
jgi:hypothetical protein